MEAENIFRRPQLAPYVERGIKHRRIDPVTRIQLAFLSRFCNWRDALVVVPPETMIRWHRAGWKLFWRLKSRPGRPPIPKQVQALIRRMGNENPTWGEERIAKDLLLILGIQVSPRTVRKYLPRPGICCLRFLRSSDHHVPVALRIRSHRAPQWSPGSFQRHRTSAGRMDRAAVARGCRVRGAYPQFLYSTGNPVHRVPVHVALG